MRPHVAVAIDPDTPGLLVRHDPLMQRLKQRPVAWIIGDARSFIAFVNALTLQVQPTEMRRRARPEDSWGADRLAPTNPSPNVVGDRARHESYVMVKPSSAYAARR
jgi:hypothetical protein